MPLYKGCAASWPHAWKRTHLFLSFSNIFGSEQTAFNASVTFCHSTCFIFFDLPGLENFNSTHCRLSVWLMIFLSGSCTCTQLQDDWDIWVRNMGEDILYTGLCKNLFTHNSTWVFLKFSSLLLKRIIFHISTTLKKIFFHIHILSTCCQEHASLTGSYYITITVKPCWPIWHVENGGK